ncbi:MAG: hypothetical protein ABH869_07875 [Candidatus Omnitrophota bacterium]
MKILIKIDEKSSNYLYLKMLEEEDQEEVKKLVKTGNRAELRKVVMSKGEVIAVLEYAQIAYVESDLIINQNFIRSIS